MMIEPVLAVEGAEVRYGSFRAVKGVSFKIEQGETVALVGESGCGKTSLARAILGLEPLAGGRLSWSEAARSARRQAEKVGMVWQDPFASLDPLWTIKKSILEPGRIAGRPLDCAQALAEVGLDAQLADRYPHELSGGQRQRAAIARALALRPPLVICDEPTAALDLSIQAQILNLIKDLQSRGLSSFLYISHDLETVRYIADRVLVMQGGEIVEEGPASQVLEAPEHPYTRRLLASVLNLERLGSLPMEPSA
jgi:peptide/nickel transport system ATP-binding protein